MRPAPCPAGPALVVVVALASCSAHTSTARRATPEIPERALLLWEVRKGGPPSYLHGTCHMDIPLENSLPAPQDAKLRGARVLVTEVDLHAIDPLTAMRQMWRGDPTLVSDLGPDAWHALIVRLRNVAPAPMLAYLRPWAAWAMLIAPEPTPGKVAGTQAPPLDQAVAATAAGARVERVFMETVEEQFALLHRLALQ